MIPTYLLTPNYSTVSCPLGFQKFKRFIDVHPVLLSMGWFRYSRSILHLARRVYVLRTKTCKRYVLISFPEIASIKHLRLYTVCN